IFVWLLGPWVAVWIIASPRVTAVQKGALIGLGFVAAVGGMFYLGRATLEQTGFVAYSAAFLEPLHLANAPTARDDLYPELIERFGHAGALPVGLALAYV